MSTLFLVATPIGNLEDISARALRTLQEVPLIAAEDTRRTGKLLAHFGIQTRMTSYHDHNEKIQVDQLLQSLAEHDVALVSDAGAPNLNDPGYVLVRAAIEHGHRVSPIPGPSAPLAALTASGLPTDSFLYLGYLPRKAQVRRELLEVNREQPHTLIFLETPHRLPDSLADIQAILGDRQVAAARELTKLHEEILRDRVSRLRRHFESVPPRGEFTLVVAGYERKMEAAWPEAEMLAAVQKGLAAGEPPTDLAKRLAQVGGWKKKDVYQLITRHKNLA